MRSVDNLLNNKAIITAQCCGLLADSAKSLVGELPGDILRYFAGQSLSIPLVEVFLNQLSSEFARIQSSMHDITMNQITFRIYMKNGQLIHVIYILAIRGPDGAISAEPDTVHLKALYVSEEYQVEVVNYPFAEFCDSYGCRYNAMSHNPW